jgi:large subunit ribosomal protein L25
MKEVNLIVKRRDAVGKGASHRTRVNGDIPAVVYGPETAPISIKVNYHTLYRAMRGVPMSTIINLSIDGDDAPARKVIIRELQKHPVTGDLLHVDFHHISMNKPITLTVPVHTKGMPLGVKNYGGIVEHIAREIDISCLPAHIPDDVVVDISELNIGESVHVSDIVLENVTILTDLKRTLVTVVAPTVVKSAAEEAAEAAEAEAAEAAEGEEGEAAAEGEGEGKAEGEKKEKKPEGGEEKKKE